MGSIVGEEPTIINAGFDRGRTCLRSGHMQVSVHVCVCAVWMNAFTVGVSIGMHDPYNIGSILHDPMVCACLPWYAFSCLDSYSEYLCTTNKSFSEVQIMKTSFKF